MSGSGAGGPFRAEESEARAPLPLRATFIVLSLWVFGMVILALVVVPAIFASCFPQAPVPTS